MKLSLAVQTPEVGPTIPVALLTGTFEEKLAKAAALGAQGVELMPADPVELDAQAVRRSVEEVGLEVSAIGTGAIAASSGLTLLHAKQEVSRQARERLYRIIQFAHAVGAPVVTIGAFRGRAAWVGEGARMQLQDTLRAAAELASAHGVRLALEPVNRYEVDLVHTAEEGLQFLRQVGHDSLGLLLDTFHVNIEESSWTQPFETVMAAGKLLHVHLGDNNRLPPGRGLIDFAAIVQCLRRGGYHGYLSAELLALPDPDTAARQALTYMRELMER
ncbi:MAG: sugar phosphate isomerase/epimerase [Anaerolineae bacterium]|nr:sugar phosphate isomerase/epimerase [Anaerolineae bacterium]